MSHPCQTSPVQIFPGQLTPGHLLRTSMTKSPGQARRGKRRVTASGTGPKRFEALLDEMSAAMARAPAHEIDTRLSDGCAKSYLRSIWTEAPFGSERRLSSGSSALIGGAARKPPKMPHNAVATRVSPWLTAKILAGESLIYTGRDDQLPKEAPKLRRFVEAYGPARQRDDAASSRSHDRGRAHLRQVPRPAGLAPARAAATTGRWADNCRCARPQTDRFTNSQTTGRSHARRAALDDGRVRCLDRARTQPAAGRDTWQRECRAAHDLQ